MASRIQPSKIKLPAFRPKHGKVNDTYGPNWFQLVKAVGDRDKVCMECGSKSGPFHTHHAIRLARGGVSGKANLLRLCNDCHEKRHRRPLGQADHIKTFKRKNTR